MLCARVTEKMASLKEGTNNTDTDTVTVYAAQALPLLHTLHPLRRTFFNRVFALVYACAILALVYRHAQTLLNCKNLASFSVTLSLLLSDLILAFMWVATQSFHIRPVHRKEYPENLEKFLKPRDFPALDVFVCTADPCKEPPIDVVNTALSVMAYDYPTEKVSVYVSDDGGSALTLFAFMEAAKFASHWLPFCREKNLMVRSPKVYFSTSESNHPWCLETQKIKVSYSLFTVFFLMFNLIY